MRVLVTGGAGFIGSFVVDRLLAAGDEVLSLGCPGLVSAPPAGASTKAVR